MAYTPLYNLTNAQKVNINGVYVAPQELTCAIMDIDFEAGRTADGKMHRNKVATKRKYTISLPPCHTSVVQPLMAAMDTPDGESAHFTATFPDPMSPSGSYTGTFYVGDRSVPVYNYAMDIWNHLSFEIVEI